MKRIIIARLRLIILLFLYFGLFSPLVVLALDQGQIGCNRLIGQKLQTSPTEVVIIGTKHWDHLKDPHYSLTHLRALLSKIHPKAVCIESLSNWKGLLLVLPQLPEVLMAISWARDAEVAIYGVAPRYNNWTRGDNTVVAFRNFRESKTAAERQSQILLMAPRRLSREARVVFERTESIEWIHSKESIETNQRDRHNYPEEIRKQMEEYEDDLAEEIVRIALHHPGDRITVVQGWAHYGPLIDRLNGRPEVTLLSTDKFLPITPEELGQAWHRDDAIMVLGTNLDDLAARVWPQCRDHRRTKTELDHLAKVDPNEAATLYYRARWDMLFNEWDKAEKLLRRVRDGASGALDRLPFVEIARWPPLPTIHAMATFALGNLYDLKGKHGEAVDYYKELLEIEPQGLLKPIGRPLFLVDLKSYLQNLITDPYSRSPEEIVRAAESWQGFLWNEAPKKIRKLITR